MYKLGELLKNNRVEKGMLTSQASEKTKIPIKYIRSLEKGDYDAFVSEVHLKGFLKNYSRFLGLNVQKVLALCRRERMEKKEQSLGESQSPLRETKAIITPGRLVFAISSIVIISVIVFVIIQFNRILQPPSLSLSEPVEAQAPGEAFTEVDSDTISIVGKVEVGSKLLINGNEVTTNNLQEFRVDNYKLNPGSNTITLIAQSYYFSKSSQISLTVLSNQTVEDVDDTAIEEPPEEEESPDDGEIPADKMIIEVEVGPEEAWLVITIDGTTEVTDTIQPETRFTFEANQVLTIYSPRPQMVSLHINGKEYTFSPQSVAIFKLVNGIVVQE